MIHLKTIQNISYEIQYKIILKKIMQTRIWIINNEVVQFPHGFVKNFNHSNDSSLITITVKSMDTDYMFFDKLMLLYTRINYYQSKNIGSFISYMHAFLSDPLFGNNKTTTAELAKLMTIDNMGVDLLMISKLFCLNNFNILKDDTKLPLYKPIMNCVEHVSSTTSNESHDIRPPPCLDLNGNPKCKAFCEWHEKLINEQLSKGELLTLMRYAPAPPAKTILNCSIII